LEAGPEEGPRSALIVVLGGDPGGGPGDIGYPGLVELPVEIAVGAGVASPASDGEGGSGAGIGEGIGVLSDELTVAIEAAGEAVVGDDNVMPSGGVVGGIQGFQGPIVGGTCIADAMENRAAVDG
jgi:hypothetical protein